MTTPVTPAPAQAGLSPLVPIALATVLLMCACAGRSSGGASAAPPGGAASTEGSLQVLYESGRYAEVVNRVTASAGEADPEAVWLAARSHLRLGQREQAVQAFAALAALAPGPAWQSASQLALAGLEGQAESIDRARLAASEFTDAWFVQHELGLAHFGRGDFTAAADAFDRSIRLNPRFAYAYYYAGLAYDRVGRADLMVARFDIFLRLAPDAPERPEIDAILRTVRGR